MGFYIRYKCTCGYVTPDDLGEVECLCPVCKEVYGDSLVSKFGSWQNLHNMLQDCIAICPECMNGVLQKWIYHCPKCGNNMEFLDCPGSFF